MTLTLEKMPVSCACQNTHKTTFWEDYINPMIKSDVAQQYYVIICTITQKVMCGNSATLNAPRKET